MSNQDKIRCKTCKELIEPGALKCVHCNSFQDWRRYLGLSSTVLALLVALATVTALLIPVIKDAVTGNYSKMDVKYQNSEILSLTDTMSMALHKKVMKETFGGYYTLLKTDSALPENAWKMLNRIETWRSSVIILTYIIVNSGNSPGILISQNLKIKHVYSDSISESEIKGRVHFDKGNDEQVDPHSFMRIKVEYDHKDILLWLLGDSEYKLRGINTPEDKKSFDLLKQLVKNGVPNESNNTFLKTLSLDEWKNLCHWWQNISIWIMGSSMVDFDIIEIRFSIKEYNGDNKYFTFRHSYFTGRLVGE